MYFGSICNKINDSISNGNAVIYASEDELIDVLNRIKSNRIIQEAEDHIQNGTLHPMDLAGSYADAAARQGYEEEDVARLLREWKNVIYRIKQDKRPKGMRVISEGSLILARAENFRKLLLYEQNIKQNARQKKWLEIICCYNKSSIDKMPVHHLNHVVRSRSHQLDKERMERRIDDYRILSMIEKGIDDVLGRNSGKLSFHTLRLIYKIDDDEVLQQPELLEDKLQKVFGRSGNTVLRSVEARLRSLIHYRH